jgi:hypothetical protein
MPSRADPQHFSWRRVRDLIGRPYRTGPVQELFWDAGLDPDALWREVRVGIYSMPPHDRQPSPVTEIDLIPSYHIRFRFKRAQLVRGATAITDDEFVLAAVTYFLERNDGRPLPQTPELPYGLTATSTLSDCIARVGSTPTELVTDEEDGYAEWTDRNPRFHVLFKEPGKRLARINIYLAPADDD